jgi:hypothetical protein
MNNIQEKLMNNALEELRTFAEYDSINGGFIAIVKRRSNAPDIGQQLGSPTQQGYKEIGILGDHYLIHRLVYAWHYKECPYKIDHINRDKSDNRIENLRNGDSQINNTNRGMHKNNTSGYTGVHFHLGAGKYVARVMHSRKEYYCGLHSTEIEAAEARAKFITKHPEFGFTEGHGL